MARTTETRRRGSLLLVPALLATLSLPLGARAATPRGIPIRAGDRAASAIEPEGDLDTFVLDLLAGSTLTVSLAAAPGSRLDPTVGLLDPSGSPIPVAKFARVRGAKTTLKRVPIPVTGRYGVVVGGGGGTAGAYSLETRAAVPKRRRIRQVRLDPDGTLDLTVPGSGGCRVAVTIRDRSGGGFEVLSVLDPEGGEVPGATGRFARRSRAVKASLDLDGPLGDYTIRLGGAGSGAALDIVLSTKRPRVKRRKLEISPVEPVVSSLHPRFGRAGTTVDIGGENFADGGVAVLFGDLPSPSVKRVSGSRILAEAPAGAGEVPVIVENRDGQAGTSSGTFSFAGDPPVIGYLTPWSGPDTGGTVVDLYGENLSRVAMVRLDGSVVSTGFERIDDGHLRFTTDSHAPGPVAVEVIDEWEQVADLSWGFRFFGTTPIIRNPDFEEGTDGWIDAWLAAPDGNGVTWEPAGTGCDGGRCVSIENLEPRSDVYWMQPITGLVPGRWYNVSAKIRGESIEIPDTTAGAAWGGNLAIHGQGRWRSTRGAAYQGTFGWKDISFTLLAESNYAYVTCRLGTTGNRATGKVWFDNLSITDADFAGSPREGEHVSLVLEASDIAAAGMREEDLADWIGKLDDVCNAYRDLVGDDPYGGERITIASVRQYPGGWAVAGNPILWEKRYVKTALESVVRDGNWSFGILHELGHDYDLDYNWVYNGEISANLKMAYALEVLDATVAQRGILYRGAGIRDFYELAFEEAKAAGEPTSWGGWVYRLLCVKDEIGWEPFRETYVGFTEKPATKVGRLNRLLDDLSEHSGRDVRELIPEEELAWVLERLE